jgi:hypothetical protein
LAERATVLSEALDPDRAITAGEIIRNSIVSVTTETEFVEIAFESADPITAQLGANSIATAYQNAVQERLEGEIAEATNNLDVSIGGITARIDRLQTEIEQIRAETQDRVTLDTQVAEIITELVNLRTEDPVEPDPVEPDPVEPDPVEPDLATQVERLTAELRARLLVGELESQQGPTAVLLAEQADAVDLLSDLYAQRSQIELEAGFVGNGVALYSPAGLGQPKGLSLVAAFVIGGAIGGFQILRRMFTGHDCLREMPPCLHLLRRSAF